MAQQLYVVSRSGSELYERLHRYFLDRPAVAVVLDRRQGEDAVEAAPERRRHNVSRDLKRRAWATVDLIHLGDLGTGDALQPATPPVVVVLEGVTAAAQAVLGGGTLRVTWFPYSFERGSETDKRPRVSNARLLLPDREPFRVSSRHCMLRREGDRVWMVDTRSRLGTTVNGTMIGGATGRVKAELRPGHNVIAIGGPGTPYRFHVILERQEVARGGDGARRELAVVSRARLAEPRNARRLSLALLDGGDRLVGQAAQAPRLELCRNETIEI